MTAPANYLVRKFLVPPFPVPRWAGGIAPGGREKAACPPFLFLKGLPPTFFWRNKANVSEADLKVKSNRRGAWIQIVVPRFEGHGALHDARSFGLVLVALSRLGTERRGLRYKRASTLRPCEKSEEYSSQAAGAGGKQDTVLSKKSLACRRLGALWQHRYPSKNLSTSCHCAWGVPRLGGSVPPRD